MPNGPLHLDNNSGTLYGMTSAGVAKGGGTAFELVPPGPGETRWTLDVLYSFCAYNETYCADGSAPESGLISDPSGNLYGVTRLGGANKGPLGNGGGTLFELIPPAPDETRWTHKVLFSFCTQGGSACTDGWGPNGVYRDASGNFFSTLEQGGAYGGGTAVELQP